MLGIGFPSHNLVVRPNFGGMWLRALLPVFASSGPREVKTWLMLSCTILVLFVYLRTHLCLALLTVLGGYMCSLRRILAIRTYLGTR